MTAGCVTDGYAVLRLPMIERPVLKLPYLPQSSQTHHRHYTLQWLRIEVDPQSGAAQCAM